MTRERRQWISLLLALAAAPASASAQDVFMGGDWNGNTSSSSQLSAPWRGGRHSGPVPDYHVVHRGDTLWDITGYYYGNPWDWPRVWASNPDIANPHWIYPDNRVRLNGGTGTGGAGVTPSSGDGTSASGSPSARGRTTPVRVRTDGYIDREALENRGRIVASPTDHMMLTSGDEIWLRSDEDHEPPARGTNLTIYRRIPESERTAGERGDLVRVLGNAVVKSYDERREVVIAEITEAVEPIERGFEVAEIPRNFQNVPPVTNDRDLQGTVAATLYPHDIVGDQNLIFTELGSEEGVRVGNRFFVVREIDPWFDSLQSSRQHAAAAEGRTSPESNLEYPPEIIAEARVVAVRPHSATLLVTRATQEIVIGERLEMRQGF